MSNNQAFCVVMLFALVFLLGLCTGLVMAELMPFSTLVFYFIGIVVGFFSSFVGAD